MFSAHSEVPSLGLKTRMTFSRKAGRPQRPSDTESSGNPCLESSAGEWSKDWDVGP